MPIHPSAAEAPEAQSGSAYREVAPPEPLREHLVCLWAHEVGDGDGHAQPVLPDACVDILWRNDEPPVVAGPATRAFVAAMRPGTRVVGVRFRPGAAAGVLGVGMDALRDGQAALGDVSPRLARRLSTAVADRDALAEKLAAAGGLLAVHLPAAPRDTLVRAAVGWLAAHPAGRVHGLARALHVSDRQLQRRVAAAVGYPPKTLHRILRFQRLLALANAAGPDAPLASLALRAGFADQAHMTRELRELAGRSPAALLPSADSALRLADLF